MWVTPDIFKGSEMVCECVHSHVPQSLSSAADIFKESEMYMNVFIHMFLTL